MKIKLYGLLALLAGVCLWPGSVAAFDDDGALAEWHGNQLTSADFVIRYKFEEERGISWGDSTFEDRREFLKTWYTRIEDEKREDENWNEEEARLKDEMRMTEQAEKDAEAARLEEIEREDQMAKVEVQQRKERAEWLAQHEKSRLDDLRAGDAN